MKEKIRINKYLSTLGVGSRREVDRLINEGLIRVNGAIASPGEKVSDEDTVEIKGKKISIEGEKKVYYLLYKPARVISASKDDRGRKTVVDLINSSQRIYPVGRLDYDTEGLLILSNDGDFFNRVIHPKSEIYKEYYVEVKGKVTPRETEILRNGVKLEDGMTLPAKVRVIETSEKVSKLSIAIREGRNRQIRKMCETVGHPVLYLKREKIGEITLGNLKKGEFRELTKEELAYLSSL